MTGAMTGATSAATWAAAAWGLVLIVSWIGWGEAIRRWLAGGQDADVGLRATWGVAATIAAGGLFCLIGLATRAVLLAWTFGGVSLAVRAWLARAPRALASLSSLSPSQGRWRWALVIPPVLAAIFLYAGAAAPNVPNPSDDWLAYLPFVKMIQQTGTVIDPFNVRRMGALGGQSYLQAFVQIVASDDRLALFDQGVCLLLVVALVVGALRDREPSASLTPLVLLVFLLTLPEIRINSASEMSSVVGFLALYRTMVFIAHRELRDARGAALVALVAAAVCTLRQSNLAVVAGLLGVALLAQPRGTGLRGRLTALALTAGLLCLWLAPWATLAFRSNHSFLFPVFPGNYDPHYAAITGQATAAVRLQALKAAAFHDEPIRTLPVLLVGAMIVARGRHRGPLWALVLATVLGFASLAVSMPDAGLFTIARYDFGFVIALALAAGLAAGERIVRAPRAFERVGIALVLFALLAQVYGAGVVTKRSFGLAYARLTGPRGKSPISSGADEVKGMQAAVPAGEPLLVMIERPYHLDYARNRILHLDLPGAASPRPGLPLASGGEAIAAYLQSQGLRYFAFVRSDRSQTDIYSRPHWRRSLTGRWKTWRDTAPLFLQIFDAADELAATRHRLHDDGHLVVVDLATRAS